MSQKARLVGLVERKLAEKGQTCELTDNASLIQSGLFDSLDLLDLATWIESEIGPGVDLSIIDITREWDTVGDILRFVSAHRQASDDGS